MLAVKSMDVRENFKSLCDKVFRGETLIVSRPKNENIVMMSESEYNEIMKAKRNAEYLAMLDFAEECNRMIKHTQLSIVDVLPEEDIKTCQQIADERGIHLKIRHFSN